MIPARIFQTWKSKVDIPADFRHWRQSFFTLNPGYEIRLLDDADNRDYVQRHCPKYLPIYDFFPKELFRADAIRPFYMFFEGGFYVDMDFECIKPLSKYTQSEQIILGSMGVDPSFPHSIPNAMLASPPLEGFWLLYLAEIAAHHRQSEKREPEYVTGPVALKNCVAQYVKADAVSKIRKFYDEFEVGVSFEHIQFSNINILPGIEWYPLDWSDPIHQQFRAHLMRNKTVLSTQEVNAIFGRSHAVTYWSHTR
jgi:mannosyltransferase OCH1-like enzyme